MAVSSLKTPDQNTCEEAVKKYLLSLLALCAGFTPASVQAQTITAFKTGEVVSGMTKQCIYNGVGSAYTRTISAVALCPLSIQVTTPTPSSAPSLVQPPSPGSITAFKQGEVVTGMTKQCIYDGLGNTYTRTISAVALCPLSIQVSR